MVQAIEPINAVFDRMRTGIRGLDEILGGGFLHGNSVLIQGTPGSGKSSLGLQLVANGAILYEEAGIIMSFEPFPQQLYRDALSFGWDLQSLEKRGLLRIIFARRDDLYSSFAEKESDAITLITDAAIELQARRVLVDSTSNFWRLPLQREEQQKLFYEFVMKLKGLNLTPILTADLPSQGDEPSREEMHVDTIVALQHTRASFAGAERKRTLEVIKTRGQNVVEGRHPFRIGQDGLRVSPYIHLQPLEQHPPQPPRPRCSTGMADLDTLLEGGFQCGTTTMLAGMSATGKTTLAGHFVAAGLAAGENAVFVTLHESSSQLIHNMEKRGLGFVKAVGDRRLTVVHATASALQLIEFYYELKDLVESTDARRVVIDGLRDFLATVTDEYERSYYLTLYNDLFYSRGISGLFTWRVDDVAGLSSLASIWHAELMDNIVYLGLLELEGKLRKMIALVKSRGEFTDCSLRELIITRDEVRISSVFSGLSGVLLGSASGHLSEAGREIIKPLMHIRDFVNNAAVETPDQAKLVIDSLRSEFEVLAEKLTRHFDIKS
jgi:circadian clock protein KaiC